MVEVHGLAFGFGAIHVNEEDFAGESAQEQGIGECRANVAHTRDGDSYGTGTSLWRAVGHSPLVISWKETVAMSAHDASSRRPSVTLRMESHLEEAVFGIVA